MLKAARYTLYECVSTLAVYSSSSSHPLMIPDAPRMKARRKERTAATPGYDTDHASARPKAMSTATSSTTMTRSFTSTRSCAICGPARGSSAQEATASSTERSANAPVSSRMVWRDSATTSKPGVGRSDASAAVDERKQSTSCRVRTTTSTWRAAIASTVPIAMAGISNDRIANFTMPRAGALTPADADDMGCRWRLGHLAGAPSAAAAAVHHWRMRVAHCNAASTVAATMAIQSGISARRRSCAVGAS
mmetsp:Transcript_690/g.2409  ORF Transcript_690/g.2409 Transcript_690/m.2409 type:complete len:249 (+) Transcript_690:203-949(+)